MKYIFIFSMMILAACGFSPMYGKAQKENLDHVEIALIPDQEGVFLRNILIDHFYQNGYPVSPTHTLEVRELESSEKDLDITIDSEATRKQIKLTATIVLIDKKSGVEILERAVTSLTSYNILGSQFTTRVSESDAKEAALADLARQIENQTTLYFNR